MCECEYCCTVNVNALRSQTACGHRSPAGNEFKSPSKVPQKSPDSPQQSLSQSLKSTTSSHSNPVLCVRLETMGGRLGWGTPRRIEFAPSGAHLDSRFGGLLVQLRAPRTCGHPSPTGGGWKGRPPISGRPADESPATACRGVLPPRPSPPPHARVGSRWAKVGGREEAPTT